MDKLSDLIRYRTELLNYLDQLPINDRLDRHILKLDQFSKDSVSLANQMTGILVRYRDYKDQYQGIIDAYKKIIDNINNAINDQGTALINSTKLLDDNELVMLFDSGPGYRTIPDPILSRIYHYSNMQYPGLIFAPCSEEYIKPMVASDPLYLFGGTLDSLREKITNFTEVYQRRLGLYTDLELLPANQFSIIFVSDFFYQLPYPQVLGYLKIMLRLLRPGGSVLFTYHNCDLYELAKYAEEKFIAYSSRTRLEKDCKEIGFNVLNFYDEFVDIDTYQHVSWAHISKPGELTTIKLSQSLGLIKGK
jgi:SAM-dependent methyltransferase